MPSELRLEGGYEVVAEVDGQTLIRVWLAANGRQVREWFLILTQWL